MLFAYNVHVTEDNSIAVLKNTPHRSQLVVRHGIELAIAPSIVRVRIDFLPGEAHGRLSPMVDSRNQVGVLAPRSILDHPIDHRQVFDQVRAGSQPQQNLLQGL